MSIKSKRDSGAFVLNRRQIVVGAPVVLASAAMPYNVAAQTNATPNSPYAFDYAWLRQTAKALAAKPYAAPKELAPDVVKKIDFDVVQKIKFRPEKALFGRDGSRFPVRFFHLDKLNSVPVQINVVRGGMAHAVAYSADDFDYGDTGLKKELPPDLGFSGFRVMDGPHVDTDWLAFQGASYFRSAGQDDQYGASARGIAVNTSTSTKEEFPRFSRFWLVAPGAHARSISIYALLDGPSLTGAYHFLAQKETGTIMDIRAELFFRNDIAQLGIAPLTSMYWYGENDRQYATDWRPEVHDSDGLALWTGKGERIWRPLIDPSAVLTNSYMDENPKGFGLMQRDRKFENYEDDGAFYNRRPSIWIEPLEDWGAGAVQLIEIPTRDEIHDNIVSFWKPKQSIKAGDAFKTAYRLFWQNHNPYPLKDIARVIATRIGHGGIPGKPAPTDKGSWKFVIDFAGGPLATMAQRYDIKPTVTTSRGKVINPYSLKVVGTDHWRAAFDVEAPGKEQINLRCFLGLNGKTLTETWLYQFFPPAEA